MKKILFIILLFSLAFGQEYIINADLLVKGDIILEGNADDANEITLTAPAVTADRTVTFPDADLDFNAPDFIGNVDAATYTGDGSALTGIAASTGGIINTGSTTIGADSDSDGSGEIALQTRGTTRITIANLGNVGIGEINPDSTLEVKGSVHITDHLRVDKRVIIGAEGLTGNPLSGLAMLNLKNDATARVGIILQNYDDRGTGADQGDNKLPIQWVAATGKKIASIVAHGWHEDVQYGGHFSIYTSPTPWELDSTGTSNQEVKRLDIGLGKSLTDSRARVTWQHVSRYWIETAEYILHSQNLDYAFNVDTSGYVGINKRYPVVPLDVIGIASFKDSIGIGTFTPRVQLEIVETNPVLRLTDNRNQDWSIGDSACAIEFYSEDASGNLPAVIGAIKGIVENTFGNEWGLAFYTNNDEAYPEEAIRIDSKGRLGIGTTSPEEKIHIDATGGTDGTGRWFANSSVSTTGATNVTIYTIYTTTDRNYRLFVNVSASQDDGSNTMGTSWSFVFKNVAGTVTESQDAVIGTEFDDSAGVSINGNVSGTSYLIRVVGIEAENWNWEISIDATVVAH